MTAVRAITRLQDADDLYEFFGTELGVVHINQYDPHPLNASDAFNAAFQDHPAGCRLLAPGAYVFRDEVELPSGPTHIAGTPGVSKITVDPALALTSAVFTNPTVPNDRTTRTDGPYRIGGIEFDGSGRVYPKYLSDPVSGDPILNPASNPTRNPNYSTKGQILLFQKVNGYEIDGCVFHGHESVTVWDMGSQGGHIHDCEFYDCGKVDDISSAVVITHFGTLRIIRSISNASPAIVQVDNVVGSYANGQQIYLENVQKLCGMALPDGLYTMKNVASSKDSFELWTANGSSPVDTTALGAFRYNVRATATSATYMGSRNPHVHDLHLHDLKRIAISFEPKGGGDLHDCLIERTGESGVHINRSWDSRVHDLTIDTVHLTDITSWGVEVEMIGGYDIGHIEISNTDYGGISVGGATNSRIHDITIRNPCPNPLLTYPYGPQAERYSPNADPPIDDSSVAGEVVERFKAGTFMRVYNFHGCDFTSEVDRITCVDDRGVTTTDYRIWVGKSGDSNRVRNMAIRDCNFLAVTLPTPPASAPVAALNAAAGNPKESRSYAVTYVIGGVETPLGPWSNMVTPDGTNGNLIDLTAIPTGPTGTTARKVYGRSGAPATEAGGTPGLVATLNDNTATTAQDNTNANQLAAADLPPLHIWFVNGATDPATNIVRGCRGHETEFPVTLFHVTRAQTQIKEFDFGFTPSFIICEAQILDTVNLRFSRAQISRLRDGVTAPTNSGWGHGMTVDAIGGAATTNQRTFGPGVALDLRDAANTVVNKATVYAWTDRGVQLSWGTPPTKTARLVMTAFP